MGMSIDETITRYKNNAEYERTHGNLQGCLEFRQLVEWLEKLQKIQEYIDEYFDDRHTEFYQNKYLSEYVYLRNIKEIIDGR